jgi:HSP20 family protein
MSFHKLSTAYATSYSRLDWLISNHNILCFSWGAHFYAKCLPKSIARLLEFDRANPTSVCRASLFFLNEKESEMPQLTRYEPWSLFNQLRDEMDLMFDRTPLSTSGAANMNGGDWVPAVDIKEENDSYVIHADIPGVDPKDIEVNMENGVLTVKGERESEKKEDKEGYRRIERSRGSFYRSFSLPDSVDADKIVAKSKNGVLEVKIPKSNNNGSRKISVEG